MKMFDGSNPAAVSPATIAASIKKPARMQAAEAELTRLKARRAAIGAEIAKLNGLSDRARSEWSGADIGILARELDDIRERIGPLRASVVEMRKEHAARVRSALNPAIGTAAERAHAAILVLQEAIDTIAAAEHALSRAGDEGFWLGAPDLNGLFSRVARLAGKD